MSEQSKNRFAKHLVKPPKKKQYKKEGSVRVLSVNKERFVSNTLNGLHEEYVNLEKEILRLEKRKKDIKKQLKDQGYFNPKYFEKPFFIYVLELENGCFYVGQSRNVDKRYKKHAQGKGSVWTKLNKPISIVEIRPTDALVESDAAKIEDDVTIEYAIKYCSQKVRGGGYCQVSSTPNWCDEVKESEEMCSHS